MARIKRDTMKRDKLKYIYSRDYIFGYRTCVYTYKGRWYNYNHIIDGTITIHGCGM